MIKQECVDEERWVDDETFKKALAVYQVLPGPEAHELCVYFGRLRGGKLGGFAAGLGFMLPGFVLMLGLSIAYVEANLEGRLDELFYGLTAAVGAIIARAVVRLSRSFITDVPLALIALASLVASLAFVGVVRARPARRRRRLRARGQRGALRRRLRSTLCPRAGRDPHRPRRHRHGLAHRGDLPRGAEGRAADLRRRLHGDPVPAGGERRRPRLAHREPVRRRARARRSAAGAADHLLDLRRLPRRRPPRRSGDDAGDLPARVRVPDLPAPPARRRSPRARASARSCSGSLRR